MLSSCQLCSTFFTLWQAWTWKSQRGDAQDKSHTADLIREHSGLWELAGSEIANLNLWLTLHATCTQAYGLQKVDPQSPKPEYATMSQVWQGHRFMAEAGCARRIFRRQQAINGTRPSSLSLLACMCCPVASCNLPPCNASLLVHKPECSNPNVAGSMHAVRNFALHWSSIPALFTSDFKKLLRAHTLEDYTVKV